MNDLTELQRLLDEATPRPWHLDSNGDSGIYTEPQPSPTSSDVATAYFDADERLIVAAVNALPDLLDAAEALERVRALHYTHECVPLDFHCFIVFGGGCAAVGTCATCRVSYPCPTIRAIDGEPQP